MGKSKKTKQNKSPPKNVQKSESIKQKRKEAVSHPQNPLPQTVSEEEQQSKKDQVTQSSTIVDGIEPTTPSPLPEISQKVRNCPSSSSSFHEEKKVLTEDAPSSDKMKGGARRTVNPNEVDRDNNKDPDSTQWQNSKRKDYKKQNSKQNEGINRESKKINSGSWRTSNSNEVDGDNKKGYSRPHQYSNRKDYKKEDDRKHNNEGRERFGHFEGNHRTRDNWRGNDHQSDDKGFDEFDKISKQKIPDDYYKKVIEIEADLFNMSVEYSLAHCVAEDMNMGSGIAVRFSQLFKRLDDLYSQRAKQGGLAILEDRGRYIYYLVTKRVSNGKPTLQTMWNSLQKLKQHIEDNNVKKLAIPRIGCGLDRLEWSVVKYMLEYTFRETDVQITVCNYQQCEDDGQASGVPHKQNKCIVKNVPYPIAEIEASTAIIYFGAQDGSMFDDIEDLDTKFRIRMDYKTSGKQLGEIIQTYKFNKAYCLYGCIVRKTKEDPFDFINFQKCITQLKKMNKNEYYYVGFQAFEDSDDLMVTKIGNMLRCSLVNIEVYVCWGGKMKPFMPQERSNNFY